MEKLAQSVPVESYVKPKMIYLLRSDDGTCEMLFPNIKSLVRWFANQSLFPSDIMQDYDRIVRRIRSGSDYIICVGSVQYSMKQLVLFGVKVQSSKRVRSGQLDICVHEFSRVLDSEGIYQGDQCDLCDVYSAAPKNQLKRITTSKFLKVLGLEKSTRVISSGYHWRSVWFVDHQVWKCYRRTDLMMQFQTELQAREYMDEKRKYVRESVKS